MKILFITATNLGDGILSTGILDYLIRQHPTAQITVACGPVLKDIFTPAPGVIKVIPLVKQPYAVHWFKLARETIGMKWDIIVDLRNSILSRILPADRKYIWQKNTSQNHKVEQLSALMGDLIPPPSPVLWFDTNTIASAEKIAPYGLPILAIGPTAKWTGKEWPASNFIALIAKLTAANGILPGARVAIFSAPGEEARAYPVLQSVPQALQIDMITKGSPLLAAAVLKRCAFYIGNDSGLMHAAAAVGIPTLGLFGYGWPHLYRPWGKHAAYVATPESPEQLIQAYKTISSAKSSLMTSLTVTDVYETAVRHFHQL